VEFRCEIEFVAGFRREMTVLPLARFNGTRLCFAVSVPDQPGGVPEPATWALFVAGFGPAGACLHRRRLVPA